MTQNPIIPREARRPNPRAAGFTLIELLTVIAIVPTMISVLLPAIFKAKQDVEVKLCRQIVGRLATACKSYAKDYEDLPPAAVDAPDGTTLTECQNFRLAMGGWYNRPPRVSPPSPARGLAIRRTSPVTTMRSRKTMG